MSQARGRDQVETQLASCLQRQAAHHKFTNDIVQHHIKNRCQLDYYDILIVPNIRGWGATTVLLQKEEAELRAELAGKDRDTTSAHHLHCLNALATARHVEFSIGHAE